MLKLVPFESPESARIALDNGGRFYNIFTHQDDGEISVPELAKVAGVFTNRQRMFLYLALAVADLPDDQADEIHEMLSSDLQASRTTHNPVTLHPSSATEGGEASKSAVVTGIPTYVETSQDFNGFMMVPTFGSAVMIPIVDQYDVYKVHDEGSSDHVLLAHARQVEKLEPQPTRFGGVLKTLMSKEGKPDGNRVFLDAIYYTPLAN